ncbi:DUF6438 domain-containing protein [Novosphingobium rosa]|uniref:DUF6438 domain-containing protein n=1 Tax=Novosphingobium rosa TaxID=76978 RepID=UPI0012EDF3FE|nr:DUF6438 domain-containing protein [Novosphingobium rosa]
MKVSRSGVAHIVFAIIALLPLSCSAQPANIDPAQTAITLERSACYGTCPVYRVTIHGDGRVVFTTGTAPVDPVDALHRRFAQSDGVLLPGTHEARIDPSSVVELIEKFKSAHYWQLKSTYRAPVTDSPTYVLTFDIGHQRKTVVDYVGREAGMPKAVTELENAVDQAAGTDRWVNGSPALIPWLEQTGFDFHSDQAVELVNAAAWGDGAEETVIGLIDRGAPLDRIVGIRGSSPMSTIAEPQTAGIFMLESAIRRGQANVFKRLVASGWLDKLGKDKAAEVFSKNAGGCSPALVDAAGEAGIGVDKPSKEEPSYPGAAQGKTALAELGSSYACEEKEDLLVKVAERLIARGANPNARDSLGRTPIYGVENLALLRFLLQHGADATVKDNDGRSMVFGSWTDAIVLELLEARASPVGKYDIDGNKTLAQQAKDRKMPLVAKWLTDHPEAYKR